MTFSGSFNQSPTLPVSNHRARTSHGPVFRTLLRPRLLGSLTTFAVLAMVGFSLMSFQDQSPEEANPSAFTSTLSRTKDRLVKVYAAYQNKDTLPTAKAGEIQIGNALHPMTAKAEEIHKDSVTPPKISKAAPVINATPAEPAVAPSIVTVIKVVDPVSQRLEYAEKVYQNMLRQRYQWLQKMGHGTAAWDPWQPWMNWWWYFQASFSCPHETQRIGSLGDGGKWVCGFRLMEESTLAKIDYIQEGTVRDGDIWDKRPSIVYSLGVSQESSFEVELATRSDCSIWAFGASVDSMVPEAMRNPSIHFQKVHVGAKDEIDDSGKVWKSLPVVMKELEHDWIDILKIDIEGSEYDVLNSLMDVYEKKDEQGNNMGILPFGQLQVEIHLFSPAMDPNPEHDEKTFERFLRFYERLESFGLRPFWNELNLVAILLSKFGDGLNVIEYSFLNTRGNHRFLQELGSKMEE